MSESADQLYPKQSDRGIWNFQPTGSQSPVNVTTEPSDPELVGRMAAGDREALAIIFRRHHGTVYRFSRQMLGSKEAAEDVTQDVFVALTRSAGRFNPSVASLSTYLYGIARNLVLQHYKRSRSRIRGEHRRNHQRRRRRVRDRGGSGRSVFAHADDPAAASRDSPLAGPLSRGRCAVRAQRPFL